MKPVIQQVFTKSIKYLGNHLTTSGRNVSQEQKMYWNLYRKYDPVLNYQRPVHTFLSFAIFLGVGQDVSFLTCPDKTSTNKDAYESWACEEDIDRELE